MRAVIASLLLSCLFGMPALAEHLPGTIHFKKLTFGWYLLEELPGAPMKRVRLATETYEFLSRARDGAVTLLTSRDGSKKERVILTARGNVVSDGEWVYHPYEPLYPDTPVTEPRTVTFTRTRRGGEKVAGCAQMRVIDFLASEVLAGVKLDLIKVESRITTPCTREGHVQYQVCWRAPALGLMVRCHFGNGEEFVLENIERE